ncbi:NAD(P)/FAD-dependent oxidoreductase [Sulfurovum sp. zt1-1]|uniref:NAD(P)/FAD-dependent oxidoreductase n=1 Tax=Sulfurovum zhangzhouensis TaxID=3019067 RepID=A0ABT7QXR2_9BACT|nr:NAD(P)/FAD-dependent oxidoreductase [Sulfurovum zhangzhouensis]MDM5271616.1 NAD(P)/FAD-dependent oxidoreductase [Sulfurovum zhangzhouensis]
MKTITIIGSGLGGLTAGALLSLEGYKVTVLEQHYKVGGSATTFKHKGDFTCEVSLHMMSGVYSSSGLKQIFKALSVYDNVEFVRVPEFFRVSGNTLDFTMPDDIGKAISALYLKYPSEEKVIDKYFDLIKTISDEYGKLFTAPWWKLALFPFFFKNIVKYKTASVKEVMDNLTENEELKLILDANVSYVTDTIYNFSFLYHAIVQYSFYTGGGWYIKGGSQKLSDHLASVIKNNGGEIITSAEVVKINHNNENCTGVTYVHDKEKTELSNDIVVSNLSPTSTYQLANIPYIEQKEIAASHLVIHIGFNKNLKSVYGERPYSTFLFRDINSIDEYDKRLRGDATKKSITFVDYSQIDSKLTDESKSVGAIYTTDYLSNWESLSEEAYQQKKQEVLEEYLNVLETEYPNIKAYIEFANVGTPKTMQKYLKTPNGTAYGFAPTNQQFFRNPEVKSDKLNNLYFAGAWVTGGGFVPTIGSGGMCHHAILSNS